MVHHRDQQRADAMEMEWICSTTLYEPVLRRTNTHWILSRPNACTDTQRASLTCRDLVEVVRRCANSCKVSSAWHVFMPRECDIAAEPRVVAVARHILACIESATSGNAR